ncbi:MAG: MFS transporter [Candidatus Glassbacteria bacterium]|nr:MFS transporter [Candidatus Glassbacteria bacterium]
MTTSRSPIYLTAACCSGYLVMGLVFSLIGVGLESFAVQIGSSVARVGSLFFLFMGGATFLMLFAVGPLIDRFGQRPVLMAGGLVCALSMWLLVHAESLLSACALMFFLGAGSAGLNGGVNTLINHLHRDNPERMLNVGNLFFGVGAVLMPLTGSWLIGGAGLGALLMFAACGCLLPVVMFAAARFPDDVGVEDFRLADAGKAVSDPLVVLFCVLIFLYVGLEASMGIWSRPVVADAWGLKAPLDQLLLAGYWGSLMTGRLLAGTLFHKIPGRKLVLRCSIGAVIGLTMFAMADSLWVAAFALWFSGLCFAPVFPTSLGSAGRVFRRYTGTIFSMIIACSVLGGVSIAGLVGSFAGAGSMRAGLFVVAGCALAMLLIQVTISRRVELRLGEAAAAANANSTTHLLERYQ